MKIKIANSLAFILLIFISGITGQSHKDPNTYSSYLSAQMLHFNLNWNIDFSNQKVDAQIVIDLQALKDIKSISLDSWNLQYKGLPTDCVYQDLSIEKAVNVNCSIVTHNENQGDELLIDLMSVQQQAIKKNTIFNLTINYVITNQSKSLSFLKPEQTSSKKQPYLFTQSQPIYGRSIMPIFDTPAQKCTWNSQVKIPIDIEGVYMSGLKTGSEIHEDYKIYFFEQTNPIPSYLIAIIAGNVVERSVGDRTNVIAEPDMIDLAAKELSDLEMYLTTLEKYIKFPYNWKQYNIVIMPPSFPLGGMENPLLTFASPSIITSNGDKSGVSVAIHEIAHSWTGNTVTCANWQNLWLNEGFTVFLERKALFEIFGEDFYKIEAYNGNSSLNDDINSFQSQGLLSYTSLQPNLTGVNPDDAFSEVPYEKGFQFLTYIEHVLQSDQGMRNFLNMWVMQNSGLSKDSQDLISYFKDYCIYHFDQPLVIINKINFTQWLSDPLLPPFQDFLKEQFKTPLIDQAKNLANQFMAYGGNAQPVGWEVVNSWPPNVKFIFLQYLFDNKQRLINLQSNFKLMLLLDKNYNFTFDGNKEIQWRWFRACVYSNYQTVIEPQIYLFLGNIGRGKMVKPIYQAFVDTKQVKLGTDIFNDYQNFYHPIIRDAVKRILGIKEENYSENFMLIDI